MPWRRHKGRPLLRLVVDKTQHRAGPAPRRRQRRPNYPKRRRNWDGLRRRLDATVRRRAIPVMVLAIVIVVGMYVENPRDWTQAASSCTRGTHSGQVTYVRDGDTIEVAGLPIRLDGLTAPEWNAPGGSAATEAMRALVDGRRLRCELTGASTSAHPIDASGDVILRTRTSPPSWCARASPEIAHGTAAAATP